MDTLDGLVKISHSEVESFLLCERRHYYSYNLKLQTKEPSEALIRGIIGHEAFATYFKCIHDGIVKEKAVKEKVNNTIAERMGDYDSGIKICAELFDIMSAYIDARLEEEKDYEILAIEEPFKLKINDDFYLSMVVDLIYRGFKGITIRDHKFVFNFYPPEIAGILPQLPMYSYALGKEGYQIDRAEYNQVRYRVTKENADNPDAKFRVEPAEISMNRMKSTAREYIRAAKRIKELRDMGIDWKDNITRVFSSQVCERCPFKSLCFEELNGDSLEGTIDVMFNRRQKQ